MEGGSSVRGLTAHYLVLGLNPGRDLRSGHREKGLAGVGTSREVTNVEAVASTENNVVETLISV